MSVAGPLVKYQGSRLEKPPGLIAGGSHETSSLLSATEILYFRRVLTVLESPSIWFERQTRRYSIKSAGSEPAGGRDMVLYDTV
jgi:hypothetical protein